MKKIFISQPMRGKEKNEIIEEKTKAIEEIKNYLNEDCEIINTYFEGFNGNRLEFLGKSIMEGLAKADIAVFLNGWEDTDGCRVEHFIATQYNVAKYYINK